MVGHGQSRQRLFLSPRYGFTFFRKLFQTMSTPRPSSLPMTSSGQFIVPCMINAFPTPPNPSLFIQSSTRTLDSPSHPSYVAQGASVSLAKTAAHSAARASARWSLFTLIDRLHIFQSVIHAFRSRFNELKRHLTQEAEYSEYKARQIIIQAIETLIGIASRLARAAFEEEPDDWTIAPSAEEASQTDVASLVVANPSLPLVIEALADSLASGRACLFVASAQTPRTHNFVVQAFIDAGLPAGCMNKIHLRHEDEATILEALLLDGAVQKVEGCVCPQNLLQNHSLSSL